MYCLPLYFIRIWNEPCILSYRTISVVTSCVSHHQVYGKEFIKSFLEIGSKYDLSADDFVATATELTAQTVWMNYDQHIRPLLRGQDVIRVVLFVSGGGVHNDYLMR